MTSLSIFNLFYYKDTDLQNHSARSRPMFFQIQLNLLIIGIIIMSDSPLGILCPVDVDCLASGDVFASPPDWYLRSDNHLDHMEHSWNTVK